MNNHDDDLKNALDDIFGSDFIEIDVSKENDKKDDFSLDNEIKDSNNIIKLSSENEDSSYTNFKNDSFNSDVNIIQKNKIPELQIDDNPDNDANINNNNQKNSNFFSNKRILIYFIIGFILGIILIYILVNYVFGVTKVVNCSNSAKDIGYKYTDEYKITYKKNKIIYVESTYTYTALNEEYKNQIQYVKDDKLRVLINSNGMPGFTYLYENSDDYFKVNGYLDFELFDYKQINEINQESTPLSYFKIDSKLTFDNLKNSLIKKGYQCIPSK